MFRGTTPTLLLKLSTTVSLENLAELWVTFKDQTTEITKTLSDVTIDDAEKTITVRLSQQDTLSLSEHSCNVQARFKTQQGDAYATDISRVDVGMILKEGVI